MLPRAPVPSIRRRLLWRRGLLKVDASGEAWPRLERGTVRVAVRLGDWQRVPRWLSVRWKMPARLLPAVPGPGEACPVQHRCARAMVAIPAPARLLVQLAISFRLPLPDEARSGLRRAVSR